MPFCFILAKGSSYAYVGTREFEEGAMASAVAMTAQRLVSENYKRDVEPKLYEPFSPEDFPKEKSVDDLTKLLLDTVDDRYLKARCARVSFATTADSPLLGNKCLIAVFTFFTNFIVFERAGKDATPQQVMTSSMDGLPDEITALTQKSVREATERGIEAEGQKLLAVNVYEVECTCEEIGNDPQRYASKRSMRLLTVTEGQKCVPSGKGCLFVELETEAYLYSDYVIFKKGMGQDYTLVGNGLVKGLSSQALDIVEGEVQHFVEGLDEWDVSTMSATISIYGPVNESQYETVKALQGSQLTAEKLDSDFIQCSTMLRLDQVAKILLVILVIKAPGHPLETVQEGDGIVWGVIAEQACQRESPSAGSKLSALLLTQRNERKDAVHNHRPHTLTGPPVQIYNPAFVTFIREMSHQCTAMDFSDAELDGALDFIDASLNFYEDKSYRRTKIHELKALGHLLSPEVILEFRTIKPDGMTTVTCPTSGQEATVRIVEMKNEIGEGGSDPMMQAECGFVLICSSKEYEPFRDASCCPMFLVGVAGPHLAVSGAIFAETFVSQRFTDYIYLGPLPTLEGRSALDHSIRRVAQVLRALRQATDKLKEYYSRLEFTLPHRPKLRRSLHQPDSDSPPIPLHPITRVVPPSFREYTMGGEIYHVDYETRLGSPSPSGSVFKGAVTHKRDQAKHDVVIKFTATYCEGAHRKLAKMGLAPSLWFCGHVESVGMYVVVMDHGSGVGDYARLVKKEHVEQLRAAVQALHEEDYVHGDIREPNILVTKDGLKFIDFDWCGKAGVARYPADISLDLSLGWHNGVRRGGLIEKEHDEHMFELFTGLSYTAKRPNSP